MSNVYSNKGGWKCRPSIEKGKPQTMKKILAAALTAATLTALTLPALASDAPLLIAPAPYTLTVSGTQLDLSALPKAPYEEDGILMVPLRLIGEALGYTVDWDPETGTITMDDGSI